MGFKLPKGVTKVVKTVKKFVGDPNVLTAAGCVLFVVTVVEAVKATPKVHDILEENKDASVPEKIVAVAKEPEVIMATVTGAGAIACVIASNRISAERIATIGAAYEMSKTAFSEYKDRVKEALGIEEAKKIEDAVATSHIDGLMKDEIKITNTGHGEQLFYFEHTGQLFRSSGNFVERVFNDLNARLPDEGSISIPELEKDLGIPVVDGFRSMGWNFDDLPGIGNGRRVEFSFEPYMNEDNQTVVRIVLGYGSEPRPIYKSVWGASR